LCEPAAQKKSSKERSDKKRPHRRELVIDASKFHYSANESSFAANPAGSGRGTSLETSLRPAIAGLRLGKRLTNLTLLRLFQEAQGV
jgi:hypothetical protein